LHYSKASETACTFASRISRSVTVGVRLKSSVQTHSSTAFSNTALPSKSPLILATCARKSDSPLENNVWLGWCRAFGSWHGGHFSEPFVKVSERVSLALGSVGCGCSVFGEQVGDQGGDKDAEEPTICVTERHLAFFSVGSLMGWFGMAAF